MAASRLVILPPALLALGVGLLVWAGWADPALGPETAPMAVAATPAREASRMDSPARAPTPSGATPVPGDRRTASSSLPALLGQPDANLRASVQAALAARAQGGRLYARALARRCAALASLPASAPGLDANDPRVQRARARQGALEAGCSQFAMAEWLALVNVGSDDAAGDPLLALQQSDADDAALLSAAFSRPDPLLLDELGERLLTRRIGGTALLYFDGQRFDDEAQRAVARAALHLLPCHFGLACDERAPDIWLACLRGDGCVASRADGVTPGADALATRIADALRAGALDRFLAPAD